MAPSYFSPAPLDTFITLGDFTCVRPQAWSRYLDQIIQERYPQFYTNPNLRQQALRRSSENSCVLQSVEKYLFHQFGTAVPEENLFWFYNQQGEGISPDQMIEAIAAVVEPLGFEIEAVLAPDEELRLGLGCSELVVGLEKSSLFHGKPGICMINIEEDYSHAFYWPKMDAAKFSRSRFRLAVLLKRCGEETVILSSAFERVYAYCRMVDSCTVRLNGPILAAAAEAFALSQYLVEQKKNNSLNFWETVEERVSKVLAILEGSRPDQLTSPSQVEEQVIFEAGKLLQRLIVDTKKAWMAAPA